MKNQDYLALVNNVDKFKPNGFINGLKLMEAIFPYRNIEIGADHDVIYVYSPEYKESLKKMTDEQLTDMAYWGWLPSDVDDGWMHYV